MGRATTRLRDAWTARRRAALAACAVLTAGCSGILGIEADRYLVDAGPIVAADSGGGGTTDASDASDGAAGADWSCLNTTVPPVGTGSVVVTFFFNDVSGSATSGSFVGTPIPGASVRSCGTLDLTCKNPISSAIGDDGGLAPITVPAGFDGYYEVDAGANYTPTILSRVPQRASEQALQGMGSSQLYSLGAGLAGIQQDPNLSLAIVTASDCNSNPAPGVQFTVGAPGPNEQVAYLENNLPSKSATATEVTGSALVFNVPSGTLTLTATIVGSTQPLRSVTALIRQGWVTFVQIRPDQAHYTASSSP